MMKKEIEVFDYTNEIVKKYNHIEYVKFVYPQLHIESYTPIDIGQNNDVFILNGSLQIPNPIYSSLEKLELGKVFTGYELIKGVPLWKDNIIEIQDNELLKPLAMKLVQFLLELHTIPKDCISDLLKLDYKHPIEEMAKLYQEIESNLFQFIRKEALHGFLYNDKQAFEEGIKEYR